MGLTSSHWGVYEFVVKNGRLSELNPFSHDPDPSPIGPSIIDLLEDRTRITKPAVRESWLDGGAGTSKLGQGPAAHSCLVEVELYDGPAQNITACNPPEIIKNRKDQ